MPRLASWMVPLDLDVMEVLDGSDDPIDTQEIAGTLDESHERIEERCEELSAQGMIQPVTHDGYVIRPLGSDYLAGNVALYHVDTGEE